MTIDGKGTGNSVFMYPEGLALDPHGNIHAACSTTIIFFTKEVVYVRMYGYDPDPLAPRPWGIAIDDEDNTLVSNGRCISIFDHHGNKIHEVGNLDKPEDIALDPRDGSVYVADFGASSVLKYYAI